MKRMVLPGLALASLPLTAVADVASTFDTDSEGWMPHPGGATSVTYQTTGGLPGGHISVTDTGNDWGYVRAPATFAEEGAYGGQLRFSLRAFTDDPVSYPIEYNVRVALTGNGLTLIAEAEDPPTESWQNYLFALVETDSWRKFSGLDQNYSSGAPVPTQQELIDVLANLDGLYIATDYSDGTTTIGVIDRSFIDNVVLTGTSGNDPDADGVPDLVDNCLEVMNADQRDSNADGIGNACDADLNNDCVVNFSDLGQMKAVFFSTDADADIDGDGVVSFSDLGAMKAAFFQAPGPSGLPNACGGS
ncbi:MAG: laminin B domain-containing protein [Pseudomonadota bacterium]